MKYSGAVTVSRQHSCCLAAQNRSLLTFCCQYIIHAMVLLAVLHTKLVVCNLRGMHNACNASVVQAFI